MQAVAALLLRKKKKKKKRKKKKKATEKSPIAQTRKHRFLLLDSLLPHVIENSVKRPFNWMPWGETSMEG